MLPRRLNLAEIRIWLAGQFRELARIIAGEPREGEVAIENQSLEDIRVIFQNIFADREKAEVVLKEALCYNDELLTLIRNARENDGVRVIMHTRVPFSPPNMDLYDIGNILQAIGVEPSSCTTGGTREKFAS